MSKVYRIFITSFFTFVMVMEAESFSPPITHTHYRVSIFKNIDSESPVFPRLFFRNNKSNKALKSRKSNEEETSMKNEDTNANESEDKRFNINIEDPGLLGCDLLAILITSELLGLTDVLLSNEFWNLGGFIQPVTISSFSTIGKFIQRDSLISICWIIAAIYKRGYEYSSMTDELSLVKSVFTIFADFCSLLIVASLIFAVTSNPRAVVDSVEIVKDVWFTILLVGVFRFGYRRTFY